MKKTGKLVAIVLAIGLIIGMIISNTTSANDVSAAVENTRVNVGDDVVVTISGNNIVQIVNLTFKYDGDVFSGVEGTYTMTGQEKEKPCDGNVVRVKNNSENKTVTIGFNAEEAVDANTQSIKNIKLKFHTNKEGTSKIILEEGSTIQIKGDDNDVRTTSLSMEQQEITIKNKNQDQDFSVSLKIDYLKVNETKSVGDIFACSPEGNYEINVEGEAAEFDQQKGLITGKSEGTVKVTIKKDGVSKELTLTVKDEKQDQDFSVSLKIDYLKVNETKSVGDIFAFSPEGNYEINVEGEAAEFDQQKGLITGKSEGTVKVTITKDGVSKELTLTVKNENSTYPIPKVPELIEIRVNESYTINISNSDKITSGIESWTSDNTSVATVNNGVVTAVGVGTATITVTTKDGMTGTTKVTVTPAEDSGSSRPVLTPASMIITEGYTITIKSDKPVKWELGNEGVVKIINSDTTQVTLQALKKGQAMITATSTADDTQQTTANIEVIEKSVEYEKINQNGGGTTDNGGTQNGGSQGNSKTGGATTQNTSSSANEAVPATGENSVETIAILVIATLFIAAIVFRKRSRIK